MSSLIERLNRLHASNPSPDAIASGISTRLLVWTQLKNVTPEQYDANQNTLILLCELHSNGCEPWVSKRPDNYRLNHFSFSSLSGSLSHYYAIEADCYKEGDPLPCP